MCAYVSVRVGGRGSSVCVGGGGGEVVCVCGGGTNQHRVMYHNNNNNTLYSSQREIKAVVRSHNEEHISVILSHETHAHTHIHS